MQVALGRVRIAMLLLIRKRVRRESRRLNETGEVVRKLQVPKSCTAMQRYRKRQRKTRFTNLPKRFVTMLISELTSLTSLIETCTKTLNFKMATRCKKKLAMISLPTSLSLMASLIRMSLSSSSKRWKTYETHRLSQLKT